MRLRELRISVTKEQEALLEGLESKIRAGEKAGVDLFLEIVRERINLGHYELPSLAGVFLSTATSQARETTAEPVAHCEKKGMETQLTRDQIGNAEPFSQEWNSYDCEGRLIPAPPPWDDPLPKIKSKIAIYNPTGLTQAQYDELSETDKICLGCAAFYFDAIEKAVRIRADIPCQRRDDNTGEWHELRPGRITDWENQLLLWFLGDGPENFRQFRFREQCGALEDLSNQG
ncbi:hypothetical protein AB4090_09865 [Acidithiobacillus sp. IBUN Pt1247-S3]|uniref:hypothetical protein n=1 Tax=Acidithiobacillus sp. IBUN Pt1247-S3 TaxID=3166642 RepID=UPI0034E53CEF